MTSVDSTRRSAAKTSIQISAESASGGFILPNDRVDVILSRREKGEPPRAIAKQAAKPSAGGRKDADTRALEQDLAAALGLDVSIEHSQKGSGLVAIAYESLDQLDEVVRRLMGTRV